MNIVANHLLRAGMRIGLACWLGSAAIAAPAPKLSFSEFEMQLARIVAPDPGLAAYYGKTGLAPVFLGPEAAPRRKALLDAIATAPRHGLPPARYDEAGLRAVAESRDAEAEARFARALSRWADDVSNGLVDPRRTGAMNKRDVIPVDMVALMSEMVGRDPARALAALPPQDAAYQTLSQMLADTLTLVAPADAPEVAPGLYRVGSRGPAVADLRTRLASIGFGQTAVAEPELFDDALAESVKRYQKAAGLAADGIAGKGTISRLNGGPGSEARGIMIAMERLRWLNGFDLSARHVWVNIPSYIAEIRENDDTVFETRVVVGKPDPDWETPEFSDEMEFVVPNPRWNVPKSIAAQSYLHKMRKDRYAVSHLDVVDRRGRTIPRDQIDFNKYSDSNFPYFLRQKPSADNALGQVKFLFPNRWNIYLHDTPSKSLFNNRDRAYSHGCVRVGRPFDLAYELLRDTYDDPRAAFHRMLDTGEEKWLKLKKPVPIHLVYFTTIPGPDGRLRHYRDVYGRDAQVWAAMREAAQAGS